MKEIVTSHYGRIKALQEQGYSLVAVSRGVPKYLKGYLDMKMVAPSWNMLHMPREQYDHEYQKILDKLSVTSIYNLLPDKCALLCYEKHPDWCHRRKLAEWLEEGTGLEITEFGMPRREVVPYDQMGKTIEEATKQESLF